MSVNYSLGTACSAVGHGAVAAQAACADHAGADDLGNLLGHLLERQTENLCGRIETMMKRINAHSVGTHHDHESRGTHHDLAHRSPSHSSALGEHLSGQHYHAEEFGPEISGVRPTAWPVRRSQTSPIVAARRKSRHLAPEVAGARLPGEVDEQEGCALMPPLAASDSPKLTPIATLTTHVVAIKDQVKFEAGERGSPRENTSRQRRISSQSGSSGGSYLGVLPTHTLATCRDAAHVSVKEKRKHVSRGIQSFKHVQTLLQKPGWKLELLDVIVVVFILANAVCLFLQTHLDDATDENDISVIHHDAHAHEAFEVVEHVFNAFFIFECVLRMWLEGKRYFKDVFSIFDVALVIATSVDMYVLSPLELGSNLGVSHLVRMFRVVRILRLVRIVHFAKHMGQLKVIVSVLDGCLPTLLSTMFILAVVNVGAGIFVSQLVSSYIADDSNDMERRIVVFHYFGNAARASYTLFEATFSGEWPHLARYLVDYVSGYWALFWIWFELVIGFAVVNVIAAIFLSEMIKASSMHSDMQVLSKLRDKDSILANMQIFFGAADTNGDGFLTREELERALTDPLLKEYLHLIEMEVPEVRGLFNLLDDREDGTVALSEFLGGALRLKGNARSVDSILIMHEQHTIWKMLNRILGIMDPMQEVLAHLGDKLLLPTDDGGVVEAFSIASDSSN